MSAFEVSQTCTLERVLRRGGRPAAADEPIDPRAIASVERQRFGPPLGPPRWCSV